MHDSKKDPLWDRMNASDDPALDYWKPEPGDAVIGQVLDIDVRETKHSGPSPVLTIADEITQKPIEVWGLHTVLRSELKKLQPKIGDRIGIKRLPDAGKGYKRYVVDTDSEPTDIDWNAVSAAGSDMTSPDLTDETAKLMGVVPVEDRSEGLPF